MDMSARVAAGRNGRTRINGCVRVDQVTTASAGVATRPAGGATASAGEGRQPRSTAATTAGWNSRVGGATSESTSWKAAVTSGLWVAPRSTLSR